MSEVTIIEKLGTAAGPSYKFYVYTRLFYKTEEVSDNKAKVYRTYAIYGPSTKLSSAGRASWGGSSMFQIGGTSVKATLNGTTYYVSAKFTDSGTWYNSGASISVSAMNAYYSGSSGTQYKSTLAAFTVSAPSLVPEYTVSYSVNGGSGAPSNQKKIEGTDLILSDVIPVLEGSVFKRWSGSDGLSYQPGDTYTEDADLTLTAVWGGQNVMHGKVSGTYRDMTAYGKINGSYKELAQYGKVNGSYKEGA